MSRGAPEMTRSLWPGDADAGTRGIACYAPQQGACMVRRGHVTHNPFATSTTAEDTSLLAKAIVDTVREPLVVLDRDLRVVIASRSF